MKQINIQNKIREKFIKLGVKMIAPDTVFFFLKIQRLEKMLLLNHMLFLEKK